MPDSDAEADVKEHHLDYELEPSKQIDELTLDARAKLRSADGIIRAEFRVAFCVMTDTSSCTA